MGAPFTVMSADPALPIVVQPSSSGDAVEQAGEARPWIEQALDRGGAVLFRGFGIDNPERLDAFTRAVAPQRPTLTGESSPRSRVAGDVFTSTDYPRDYPIQLHNEYSYARRWPMKLFFGCMSPPTSQGATPIADSRKVLARLPKDLVERFRALGVRYRRNFLPRVGVSWETAFGTTDRAVVERLARDEGITVRWGEGGRLTTEHTASAIGRHPRTGEEMWFNHAFFFHVRALEPDEIRDFFLMQPEDDLSTQTYFGDGSPITEDVVETLRAAYRAETTRFDWQRGDVLLIDNMLTSHGRDPFDGPRKIVVVMADEHGR